MAKLGWDMNDRENSTLNGHQVWLYIDGYKRIKGFGEHDDTWYYGFFVCSWTMASEKERADGTSSLIDGPFKWRTRGLNIRARRK